MADFPLASVCEGGDGEIATEEGVAALKTESGDRDEVRWFDCAREFTAEYAESAERELMGLGVGVVWEVRPGPSLANSLRFGVGEVDGDSCRATDWRSRSVLSVEFWVTICGSAPTAQSGSRWHGGGFGSLGELGGGWEFVAGCIDVVGGRCS